MRYGLLGEKLSHSHSPRLHALLGDAEYALCPLPPEALPGFLTAREFDGLNVTIPYKRTVMPYCAELGETALAVGSVNTLVKKPDGSLLGENTDAYGFAKMAEAARVSFSGRKVLVLGSGGTSLTAFYVIRQAGGTPVVISRGGETTYAQLDEHADAQVIVNATPVGMYPQVEASPVDLRRFPALQGVLDAVYNPLRTRLLQQAESLGIAHGSGLAMLVWQAVRARELFDGRPVPPDKALAAERELRMRVSNLVLVGMPGCGKTTLGRRCASALGYAHVDTDAEIVRRAGKPIPQIFAEDGEPALRTLEAEVIAEFGMKSGQVISTGGGAVLREENRFHLRLNGVVVWITRPIALLQTGGRPLSQRPGALETLEQTRKPLYRACADYTVANECSPAESVRAILEGFHENLSH